eukprot:Clim_evm8s65 gene=Clim_evmTU8s65
MSQRAQPLDSGLKQISGNGINGSGYSTNSSTMTRRDSKRRMNIPMVSLSSKLKGLGIRGHNSGENTSYDGTGVDYTQTSTTSRSVRVPGNRSRRMYSQTRSSLEPIGTGSSGSSSGLGQVTGGLSYASNNSNDSLQKRTPVQTTAAGKEVSATGSSQYGSSRYTTTTGTSNGSYKRQSHITDTLQGTGVKRSDLHKKSSMSATVLTPRQALKLYNNIVTPLEAAEIMQCDEVYFVGPHANKTLHSQTQFNHGYDDDRGDYIIIPHDHISYRYEIIEILGKGSFGQVVKCYDHKNKCHAALKIIRNKRRFHHQALVEVRILEHLRNKDTESNHCLIHMRDNFYFRSHLIIDFELMSINLYEFIKINNFQGFSLSLVRRFSVQILMCLKLLHKCQIIHCDMKPENILLKSTTKSQIKVIDFGSSCYIDQKVYTYIQSRFYRSPEVILGQPYSLAIDMWSLGCILAELFTGYPLFPGENEEDQLLAMMEVLGLPPPEMIASAPRRKVFFHSNGQPRVKANSRGKIRKPATKSLHAALRCNDNKFLDFLLGCLQWDPEERLTPEEALEHPWFEEVRSLIDALRNPTQSSSSRSHSIMQSSSNYGYKSHGKTSANSSLHGSPTKMPSIHAKGDLGNSGLKAKGLSGSGSQNYYSGDETTSMYNTRTSGSSTHSTSFNPSRHRRNLSGGSGARGSLGGASGSSTFPHLRPGVSGLTTANGGAPPDPITPPVAFSRKTAAQI